MNSLSRYDVRFFVVLAIVIGTVVGLYQANRAYVESVSQVPDLAAPWTAAYTVLTEDGDPYLPGVGQMADSLLDAETQTFPRDEYLYLYPYYTLALYAPFLSNGEFGAAQAVWMTFMEVCLAAFAYGSLRLTRWRPDAVTFIAFILFAFGWYHNFEAARTGNLSLAVAVAIVFGLQAIQSENDQSAGIWLALTLLKPSLSWLFVIFVLFWALSVRRTEIWRNFFITLAVLGGASFYYQPDWFFENIGALALFVEYAPPGVPETALPRISNASAQTGQWVSYAAIGLLAWEWALAWGKSPRWSLWTAILTLVAGQLVGVWTTPDNYVVVFPAIVMAFSVWQQRSPRGSRVLVWGLMMVLAAGFWTLALASSNIQLTMFFPAPAVGLGLLYWVRHWALHDPSLPIEQLRALRNL